jgi:alcohol dehydrogenase (cytochrome c)
MDTRDPSKVYGLRMVAQLAPGTKMVGTVWAISAETGMTTWKVEQQAGALSLAVTAGGLVFGGDANGHFRAFDDRNGKVLWDINLGSSVSGYPISFAADGKQYIAVITGPSLVANSEERVAELPQGNAPNVFVFALP